jgi:TRAP-type C4-dicarboxylate transport system permease small subunit
MTAAVSEITRFLRKRSENVAALLMAAMFVTFIVQVVLRYAFNAPVGWTSEVQTAAWLWLILWGSALLLREDEEIRFDIVYQAARGRTRRILRAFASSALVAAYLVSLPAVYDFITFMRIEKSAYLDVRFDYLFSIYLVFVAATIVRHGRIVWRAARGLDGTPPPIPEAESLG